jgi:hypothetical protein
MHVEKVFEAFINLHINENVKYFLKNSFNLKLLCHIYKIFFNYFVCCPGDLVNTVDFSSAQNGILWQFSADMGKGKVSFRKVEKSSLHRLEQLSSVGNVNKHCR